MIKAVVPVKLNSERCFQKNVRPFSQKEGSLLDILINKLKELPKLDEIIINTESDEIIEIAKKHGVGFHKRPEELSTGETEPKELAHYIAENTEADYIFLAHTTNPFVTVEKMNVALELDRWKDHDSINSALQLGKHIWHAREPLYDTENRPNTQKIKNIIALDYSFNLIARETMLERSDFIGKNPAFIILDEKESFDIDTETDFEIAQLLYGRKRNA
jgi:CMP-N-acetylneuraminic acid synthetase